MALDPAGVIAHDRLPVAGEDDRLDGKAGLLANLADDRLLQSLAEFDDAAGERVEAVRRRPRPADDQHASVAKIAEYGGAHR